MVQQAREQAANEIATNVITQQQGQQGQSAQPNVRPVQNAQTAQPTELVPGGGNAGEGAGVL